MQRPADRKRASTQRLLHSPGAIAERRELVGGLLPLLGSARSVARELGVSEEVVRQDTHALGLALAEPACSPSNRLRSSQRALEAVRLYVELEMPEAAVAAEVGVSKRQVGRYLAKHGVAIRPWPRPWKNPEPGLRQCPVCETWFRPTPKAAARGDGKFCSRPCSYEHRRRHPRPEPRECALLGCDRVFTPRPAQAARGDGKFCCHEHYAASPDFVEMVTERARNSWATGAGLALAALAAESEAATAGGRKVPASPPVRRRWHGKWHGQRGGRPRASLSDSVLAEIARLHALGWGRPAIAKKLEISEHQVRRRIQAQG
jgi:hypothetical protein